ncbi:ABC transporter ATP-binding protein [Bacillus sp. FSL W7-1360]
MPVLETKDLTKQFGTTHALNGVNMQVEHGEVYGFIGPNGAGKSTTIRILLGMLKASSGEATIFGKNVWKDAVDIHRRISYVPGDVNLWPNLTGGEVIDFLLKLRGKARTTRVQQLIEQFQLDPTKKCRTYSKGNRQKVALITAFAADSDLYLLDEPTSGLDPLMERVFQDCVQSAKQEGKSILLSSHILSEVERLCDRVAIIRQGQVIESGTLAQLRHLTRIHVTVETQEQIPALHEQSGVYEIDAHGHTASFYADETALDTVMRYISSFGILKLQSTPLTLEDLFMRHYNDAGEA